MALSWLSIQFLLDFFNMKKHLKGPSYYLFRDLWIENFPSKVVGALRRTISLRSFEAQ